MRAQVSSVAVETFRSIGVRNFRLWFIGQTVSLVGYFMQTVAQALLVLELTGSGSILGLVTALQYLPILVFGPWAGVLCDRFDKRISIVLTQAVSAALTMLLALLVFTDTITIGALLAIASLTGLAAAFEQPTRRTIVTELVSDEQATNAVSLNTALTNLAKIVGPAVAGVVVATAGTGWCFVANGATSLVVIAALLMMDRHDIRRSAPLPRARGQIKEGFSAALADERIRTPLIVISVLGVISFNWNVLLPLLATREFNGGAASYALLFGTMSAGALLGSLWYAQRRSEGTRLLAVMCLAFGVAALLLAASPTLAAAAVSSVAVGATSMVILNDVMSNVQLRAAPHVRGRVMALFGMVLFGGIAIGGPASGWFAEHFGARGAFAIAAAVAIACGGVLLLSLRRRASHRDAIVPASPDELCLETSL